MNYNGGGDGGGDADDADDDGDGDDGGRPPLVSDSNSSTCSFLSFQFWLPPDSFFSSSKSFWTAMGVFMCAMHLYLHWRIFR